MRFQQSSDEMTGSTAWVKEIPTWSPMADEYISKEKAGEPVTPVSSMVDYTTLNYHQETGFVVNSEKRTSVMEEVWYWSPLEGRRISSTSSTIRAGARICWTGRAASRSRNCPSCRRKKGTLGRMTVPVPVGEGYVLLEIWRYAAANSGRWITWATVGVLVIAGGVSVWRRSRRRAPVRLGSCRIRSQEVWRIVAASRKDGVAGMQEWGETQSVRQVRPMIHAEEVEGLATSTARRAPIVIAFRRTSISTRTAGARTVTAAPKSCLPSRIRNEGIWVHTKPHYPAHIFRLPSGGVHWDEPVEDALLREVAEETGL